MQDSSSFWSDIKELTEKLAKTPSSYCFARLSEVYLKVGLLDDALQVARDGVAKFPRYLSGQKAFAMACQANGLRDEAISALKIVTETEPEDITSQKLLGKLLLEDGNQDAACLVFMTALDFAPDDVECKMELEMLERARHCTSDLEEDDEIIEDLEILEEIELFEEDEPENETTAEEYSGLNLEVQNTLFESTQPTSEEQDPLSTSTLAELYVSQGFIQKAVEIYHTILVANPSDTVSRNRLAELETIASKDVEALDDTFETTFIESETAQKTEFAVDVAPLLVTPEMSNVVENEPEILDQFKVVPDSNGEIPNEIVQSIATPLSSNNSSILPKIGTADNAVATLDGWLENIRRIKSCR